MQIVETRLAGVFLIENDRRPDSRGSFEVIWQQTALGGLGLDATLAQTNLARNARRNTLRGMHYQTEPFAETKLIRPVRGAVFDVAVDLRPGSPTFRQWVGAELDAESGRMLYVPKGFAHGYQTLCDDTDVFYFVSAPYSPAHQAGFRWNDPRVGITWPLGAPAVINDRDATYPDLT